MQEEGEGGGITITIHVVCNITVYNIVHVYIYITFFTNSTVAVISEQSSSDQVKSNISSVILDYMESQSNQTTNDESIHTCIPSNNSSNVVLVQGGGDVMGVVDHAHSDELQDMQVDDVSSISSDDYFKHKFD